MGTATAAAKQTPRSHSVHSRRVPARMETISPFFTPSAIRPQATSSLCCASCDQGTSCQAPFTLRRAAIRVPSMPACARRRRAARGSLRLPYSLLVVVLQPPLREVLEALLLGRIILAALGVQDVLRQALRL